jgi:hypothetical protein
VSVTPFFGKKKPYEELQFSRGSTFYKFYHTKWISINQHQKPTTIHETVFSTFPAIFFSSASPPRFSHASVTICLTPLPTPGPVIGSLSVLIPYLRYPTCLVRSRNQSLLTHYQLMSSFHRILTSEYYQMSLSTNRSSLSAHHYSLSNQHKTPKIQHQSLNTSS